MADVEWEIALRPNSAAQRAQIAQRVIAAVEAAAAPGVLDLQSDPVLAKEVHSARATVRGGAEPWSVHSAAAASKQRAARAPGGAAQTKVFVHPLYDEGPTDEYTDGMAGSEEENIAWTQTLLPAASLDGHWESLLFEAAVKHKLLAYARSALAFSTARVDSHLVSCHRLLLLHGPPGTGKTSLCRALSHKLLARSSEQFAQGQLIELNAHSLFSKWFSESGKLVGAVFAKVRELLDDSQSFVAVLVDEVESLAASRAAALNGSEPSDAVRVVNAVLTQLDSLKAYPNVLVLATSNITAALDAAFADRADLSLYIGLPEIKARYCILASCVAELARAQVLDEFRPPGDFDVLAPLVPAGGLDLPAIQRLAAQLQGMGLDGMQIDGESGLTAEHASAAFRLSLMLYMLAQSTGGWSGRSLRRLPLLAHAEAGGEGRLEYAHFLLAMHAAVQSRDNDASKFEPAGGQQAPVERG